MLKVFYGTDVHRVRSAAFACVAQVAPEQPAEVIDTETYQPGQLADAVGGASLFGETRVTVIDTPADALAEELITSLPALAESADTFVVIEGSLLAAAKKRYQKYAAECTEFAAEKTERFNTFALADALARKDKKTLWLGYQQATLAGISPEEIAGILWWQLKSVRLAAVTSGAAEAGMKDFPYNKAKRALAVIPLAEATRLSHELLTLYHQGHQGEVDLPLALEQWILTL